jgi:hypothetical protein
VLPVFVNGLVPPLPRAARCAALGRTVAAAVRAAPGDRRVALLASGSFSLEVGGPHLDQGRIFGVPDPGWAARVLGYPRATSTGSSPPRRRPSSRGPETSAAKC